MTEADRLGYDSVWTAESYGSDALTPLAWWGSRTERVRLGTSLCQLSARTPTAMAMAALTMDHLSGGRFVLGLGVSGPQVVEGWYGQPFPAPLARTREYVDVVRQVLAREKPVTNDGPHYPLPYPGGTGLGKPLKSIVHPLRADIPIILGAEGPKNVALAAEIADGWFPIFFSPQRHVLLRGLARRGLRPAGARASPTTSRCWPSRPTVITDDTDAAADGFRPYLALYIGGMGAKEMNFHFDVFARMGYEEAATKIQDAYLDGRKDDAAAAVPTVHGRGHRAGRPGREDPRRPRGVARVARHHDARQRRPRHPAHHGRAGARLGLAVRGRANRASRPGAGILHRPRASAAGPTYRAGPKPRIGMKMKGKKNEPDPERQALGERLGQVDGHDDDDHDDDVSARSGLSGEVEDQPPSRPPDDLEEHVVVVDGDDGVPSRSSALTNDLPQRGDLEHDNRDVDDDHDADYRRRMRKRACTRTLPFGPAARWRTSTIVGSCTPRCRDADQACPAQSHARPQCRT